MTHVDHIPIPRADHALTVLNNDLSWAAVQTARLVHFLAGVESCPQSRRPVRARSRRKRRRRVTVTIHVE